MCFMADSILMRKFYHTLFLFTRPITLGVRIVVENEQKEVLLVRHTYVKGWYLPGGGVERGETIYDAARKEVREETGIEILDNLELVNFYKNNAASNRDHVALLKTSHFNFAEAFVPNREIHEIGFFALDALPDTTTKANIRRLNEVYHGEPVSPYW